LIYFLFGALQSDAQNLPRFCIERIHQLCCHYYRCEAYMRAYRDQWAVLENSGNVHNNSFARSTDQNEAASVNIQGNNKLNIGQAEQSHQSFASGELDFTPGQMVLDSPSSSNSGADNPRCLLLCASIK
jgi:hypothetical protein